MKLKNSLCIWHTRLLMTQSYLYRQKIKAFIVFLLQVVQPAGPNIRHSRGGARGRNPPRCVCRTIIPSSVCCDGYLSTRFYNTFRNLYNLFLLSQ